MQAPLPELTFFAGISSNTEEPHLEKVSLEAGVQSELSEMFANQADMFLTDDTETVEFNPKENYRLERGQVYVIKDFDLSSRYKEAVLKPHQADEFEMGNASFPRIVTFFGSDARDRTVHRLLFQQFRSPQLLDRRFSLLWKGNVFSRISGDGISLAHELAAIWQNGHLFFRSFSIVRRFFDLAEFEPKATPEEVASFVRDDLFAYEDDDSMQKIFRVIENDDFLRRRIASIVNREILTVVRPRAAANKAAKFDIVIPVRRPNGKDKIALPSHKRQLKEVVRFLNEEYFHGELTDQLLETNSLRPHGKG
ncbi:hypothetical protein [Rubinisphaera margarita]|uniref:hypothetical protein n=1 Tax=Rubinisphaera margarita TaxID=2909586 RepID=UPI001EE91CF8|nr:hypothetical protein [Rubinisphaera margarita]MCG6157687.1 hypothetical protein [Rubinisphaera margarita]